MASHDGPKDSKRPRLTLQPRELLFQHSLSFSKLWERHRKALRQKQKRNQSSVILFDLVWLSASADECTFRKQKQSDSFQPSERQYVLACTSHGELCLWYDDPARAWHLQDEREEPIFCLQPDKDPRNDTETNEGSPTWSSPICRWKVSKGSLYSIQILEQGSVRSDHRRCLLSGDEGVLLMELDLEEVLHLVLHFLPHSHHKPTSKTTPLSPYLRELARFCPHPCPRLEDPWIEVNQTCQREKHVYGAAGDAFGCYKWDMETQRVVATYPSPGQGYLHTLQFLEYNVLATGGEDGILCLWDVQQRQRIHHVDFNRLAINSGTTNSTPKTNPPKGRKNAQGQPPQRNCWISTLASLNENWLAVGGGIHHAPSKSTSSTWNNVRSGGPRGILAMYHVSTRSLVASSEANECIHKVAGDCSFVNSNNKNTSPKSLASAGNEETVSFWNPWTLERENRSRRGGGIPLAAGFALATSPDGQRLAFGGVGPAIQFLQGGQVVAGLNLY